MRVESGSLLSFVVEKSTGNFFYFATPGVTLRSSTNSVRDSGRNTERKSVLFEAVSVLRFDHTLHLCFHCSPPRNEQI